MSKQKKFGLIILVNLLIVIGMLYLFEGYLRLTDPHRNLPPNGMIESARSPSQRPARGWGNYIRYTWGHVVVNNRYGFRERDFAVPKPKGVYRIMVLGDSLTWGQGLAVEQRYTNLLENSLKKTFPGRKFEVLNFGLQGYPTTQERDVLQKHVGEVEPDLIVVGFCYNDPQPKFEGYSAEWQRFADNYATYFYLLRKLDAVGLGHTGKRIKDATHRVAGMRGSFPSWEQVMERAYNRDSEEWRNFEQALRDIKSIADQESLPAPIFAVLNEGVYTDRPTNYSRPDAALQRRLRWYHQAEATASKIGFRSLNYEKEIAQQFAHESLAVNIVDRHPSAKLNRLYADKLHSIIAKQVRSSKGDHQ